MRFLPDLLTLFLLVGIVVVALIAGDLISRAPELIARAIYSARVWSDRRRKPKTWAPGGYRVKGVRRT
ncbi:MAG: hypothetical protein ACJ74Q_15700 [Pyrinomonadaceae bacterium]